MTLERRIRADIETRIHSGEWRPGDRIPSEHELVATYGCARATVGKALGALTRTGLIERRRKAGSFVARPELRSAVLDVPDLEQLIVARGEAYRWERRQLRHATARETTDADLGPDLLFVEGVHHCGSAPFALESRLISLTTVAAAARESFAETAPGSWLLRHLPWTRAEHAIRAVEASGDDALSLGIERGSACLRIERRTWKLGEPVTKVSQLFAGDRFELVGQFDPCATTPPR